MTLKEMRKMTDLISNRIIDKCYPNERKHLLMIKAKKFEKDCKRIFSKEKVTDYRCYLHQEEQIIYYSVETPESYIAFKQVLWPKREPVCFIESKAEFGGR